jgi:hypothetical protein
MLAMAGQELARRAIHGMNLATASHCRTDPVLLQKHDFPFFTYNLDATCYKQVIQY